MIISGSELWYVIVMFLLQTLLSCLCGAKTISISKKLHRLKRYRNFVKNLNVNVCKHLFIIFQQSQQLSHHLDHREYGRQFHGGQGRR